MKPVPQFSPAMLQFFLRAGAAYRVFSDASDRKPQDIAMRFRADMRRAARVTAMEMEMAWMGRLNRAEPRAKLWAALKIDVADFGVRLTDQGGQEVME